MSGFLYKATVSLFRRLKMSDWNQVSKKCVKLLGEWELARDEGQNDMSLFFSQQQPSQAPAQPSASSLNNVMCYIHIHCNATNLNEAVQQIHQFRQQQYPIPTEYVIPAQFIPTPVLQHQQQPAAQQ